MRTQNIASMAQLKDDYDYDITDKTKNSVSGLMDRLYFHMDRYATIAPCMSLDLGGEKNSLFPQTIYPHG